MKPVSGIYHRSVRLIATATLLIGSQMALAETHQTEATENVYRAPLSGEPTTLDPALYSDIYAMQVANNLFDGLVEFDENLNVVPAIARRWKISRDRRSYTFVLRDGVTFHNGRKVTADDFVFAFTRLLDPELKSPAASFFSKIQGAKEFSEGTSKTVSGLQAMKPNMLKIDLSEPFAPFLSILAMANAKVVPQESVNADFGKQPVGTGPFRFNSWKAGEGIELSSNDQYFAGQPALDGVLFRIYPNSEWEEIFADFEKGDLEHALIPRERYDELQGNESARKSFQMINKPGLNLVYVGINQGVTPFADVRVRQAVNYAVDTDSIVKNIAKRGTTSVKGILPPGIAGFDPDFQGYGYDPQKARDLLSEAGFPEGKGFPTVQLWTVSKSEGVRSQLEAYKTYLADVGVPVEIQVAENWKAFVAAITGDQAGLYYASWYADYPDADNFFYPLTHSTSRTNRMKFNEPGVDKLLDSARAETDYLQRVQLYRDAERLVVDNAPLVSQHANANNYLFQSWVRDAELNSLGMIYLPLRLTRLEK